MQVTFTEGNPTVFMGDKMPDRSFGVVVDECSFRNGDLIFRNDAYLLNLTTGGKARAGGCTLTGIRAMKPGEQVTLTF